MDVDQTALLEVFRTEAVDHFKTLDSRLLALERAPADRGPVRDMFLSAHTIKGGAAMVGLKEVATLAHGLEDVLQRLRRAEDPLDEDLIDLLFRTVDLLRELVDRPSSQSDNRHPDMDGLLQALQAHTQAKPETSAAPEPLKRTPRALLVEDSMTVRMLESEALEEAGFMVDESADAARAMEMLPRKAYDLVVTGNRLRDMRGLELAAALRRLDGYSGTPVVLTCIDAPSEQGGASDVPAVHVVTRPSMSGRQELVLLARRLAELGSTVAADQVRPSLSGLRPDAGGGGHDADLER